jgi:hypothetical protein
MKDDDLYTVALPKDDNQSMMEDLEAESFIGPQNDKDYDQTKPSREEAIPKTRRSISNILLICSMGLNIFVVLVFQHHYFVGAYPDTKTSVVNIGEDYVPSNVIYGHLHVAKTAGTEFNGKLASQFERVCGNKGYSYDAYQFNERAANSGETLVKKIAAKSEDLISKQFKKGDRGKVPGQIMQEIGFEDCDYISAESPWRFWKQFNNEEWPWPSSLELHVPCRDPLKHLMSQCNHRSKHFNCTAENLPHEISNCMLVISRFSRALEKQKNIDLKCFNPIPMEPYLEYMGERLQRKRIEASFFHRDSNTPRDKGSECIWNEPDVAKQVRAIMLAEYDYYGWCEECLGSKDDLLVLTNP